MSIEHWLQLHESLKEETVGKIIAIATRNTDGTVIMRNGSLMMTMMMTMMKTKVIISYFMEKTIGDEFHTHHSMKSAAMIVYKFLRNIDKYQDLSDYDHLMMPAENLISFVG